MLQLAVFNEKPCRNIGHYATMRRAVHDVLHNPQHLPHVWLQQCCICHSMSQLLIACGVLTGTLFVLMKDPSPKQQLLEAVTSQGTANEEVQELIQQLQSQSPERRPASSVKNQGKWRLLWSMQVGTAQRL